VTGARCIRLIGYMAVISATLGAAGICLVSLTTWRPNDLVSDLFAVSTFIIAVAGAHLVEYRNEFREARTLRRAGENT
jgi:hypothetical protein